MSFSFSISSIPRYDLHRIITSCSKLFDDRRYVPHDLKVVGMHPNHTHSGNIARMFYLSWWICSAKINGILRHNRNNAWMQHASVCAERTIFISKGDDDDDDDRMTKEPEREMTEIRSLNYYSSITSTCFESWTV